MSDIGKMSAGERYAVNYAARTLVLLMDSFVDLAEYHQGEELAKEMWDTLERQYDLLRSMYFSDIEIKFLNDNEVTIADFIHTESDTDNE